MIVSWLEDCRNEVNVLQYIKISKTKQNVILQNQRVRAQFVVNLEEPETRSNYEL